MARNANPLPESSATASGWPWLLPRLAFVLFAGAVFGLFWLSERGDRDEQRATLISDVLWLEQDLRFLLTRNEEHLAQFRPASAMDKAVFQNFARVLLRNDTGLRQVFWLDSTGRLKHALPAPTEAYMVGEGMGAVPSVETTTLARSLGKPSYGPAYPIVDGDWQFEVHVPIFDNEVLVGVAVGAYSIKGILDQAVPWWLAERYRVLIKDNVGTVLGARSKVSTQTQEGEYEIPFDPPGRGLSIQAVPYRSPASPAGRLLSTAIAFLAVLVLVSYWALRRHVQGRLLAEQALRAEHLFRKAMEDSLETGMRARDLSGRITYVNPAFCRMVGIAADELVGCLPPMPYWIDEDLDRTREIHDDILAGHTPGHPFELRFKHRDGHTFWALIHEAPLIDAEGRQTGWMGSVVDITERRRVQELERQHQERVQASARLVAMGEMASSIAHELNQPLAAISSYTTGCLNLLQADQMSKSEMAGALSKIGEQAHRAGRIIRRIYEFVRRHEPRSERIDLKDLVDEATSLTRADADRLGLRIEVELSGELPPVIGDRVLLGQALFNLLRNAIDAMRGTRSGEPVLRVIAERQDSSIRICVEDHGSGIPGEIAHRLFEPFFTSKSEGMGMGLNIARTVVESHHGRLWFEPNPEGGSRFCLSLPISDQA